MNRFVLDIGPLIALFSVRDTFRAELYRTRNAHPGIEDRTASLEKTAGEIQQRLVQEFVEKQIDDASEIVSKLIYGDRTLAPHLLPQDSLGIISRSLVRVGATILHEIYPETLFAPDELQAEWASDHYREWRYLYLAANENNEEILVGIA